MYDDQFSWQCWDQGTFPSLELHSRAKLNLTADYVTDYIKIVAGKNFGATEFKLTVVDGFAGGGRYRDGFEGSPFVLMKAVRLAEAEINQSGRRLPLKVDAHFYFVEQDRFAFECLKHEIQQSEFKDHIGRTIFLFHGLFGRRVNEIIINTNERHKRGGGRVLFFLDQCGYSAVNPAQIRRISGCLNGKAEFIINFAVDWFSDFMTDSQQFRTVFEGLHLDEYLDFNELVRLKREQSVSYPFLLESKLASAYWNVTGIPYFSPFYIQPEGRHRGYWLLHLAPHARARSAMADVHWRNANGSRHYGGRGLGMLAFKPNGHPEDFLTGMSFTQNIRTDAKTALMEDLSNRIRSDYPAGVLFTDLVNAICNETMANIPLVGEALAELASEHSLIITGPQGGAKRTRDLTAGDVIMPSAQLVLTFGGQS